MKNYYTFLTYRGWLLHVFFDFQTDFIRFALSFFINMNINIFRCAFIALMLSIFGRAAAISVTDSLTSRLASANTSADSISLLYNIFDCSNGDTQQQSLESLYQLASRQGDENTILDVLRLGANLNATNDSVLNLLLERAKALPDSDNKRATILFIKVRSAAKQIRTLPEETRDKRLRQYLSYHKEAGDLDIYQQIEYLFSLCAYLRLATDGDLLIKYFTELQGLIDRLPSREIYLRSLFYTQAAVSYLDNGLYDKAVEANKTLLDIIAELEKQYRSTNRQFRNYNRSKYVCYRRLLRCHAALSKEETDFYFNGMKSLIDEIPDARYDFEKRQRPTIYYLMAQKKYQEVIPIIIKQLNDKDNTREEYRYLVESLIEASDATDDKHNLLMALQLNNDLLKKRIEEKAAESYKELQIVYEVNDLKQVNDDLAMANQQIILDRHNEQLTFAAVGLIMLLLLLIVVTIFYRRAKRLSKNLIESNVVIAGERDALQRAQKELIEARDKAKLADRIKTDFVNNMSHEIRTPLAAIVEYSNLISDCADDDKRSYIKRFADIISLNTDLLLTLVNDVLDLPSIENAKISVRTAPASAREICNMAIDSIRKHVSDNVSLSFNDNGNPDVRLITDQHRVEQVLINLLTNAAKFTENGHITLEYTLSHDRKQISFSVSDTGIGIPRGKEDIIFSRFEKLNSETQGNGLGLYIGRLMANLLKGSLTLDRDYRGGARFVFTIPIDATLKSDDK